MVISTAVTCFLGKPSTAHIAAEELSTRETEANCNSRRLNDFHIEPKGFSIETLNFAFRCSSLTLRWFVNSNQRFLYSTLLGGPCHT
jgi:hypothetical protein